MGKEIKRRIFWNQAGFGGLIVGGILSLALLATYLFRNNPELNQSGIINSPLAIIGLIVAPYLLGKRFSMMNALCGLTFKRALGYMFVVYILAGFIYGVSAYIIFNLDLEYYISRYQGMVWSMNLQSVADVNLFENMIQNPISMVLNLMSSMPFLACLPAFIISALIKRNPALKD